MSYNYKQKQMEIVQPQQMRKNEQQMIPINASVKTNCFFPPGEYGAAVSFALHFWATNARRLSTCHKTPYKLMVFLTDIRILSHSFPSALHWGPYYRKLVSLKWLQKVSKRRKSSTSAKPPFSKKCEYFKNNLD